MWGNHVVHIDGRLNLGDEKKVAAIDFHDPEHTVVQATGPGGNVYPALQISDVIHQRGWATMLAAEQLCASACTYIWLSGRRSVIQRGALLCFHQVSDGNTHQPLPEVNPYLASRLVEYGLTRQQAWALVNAAPPEDARCMNPIWSMLLGFHPQSVFTFGAVNACRAKFCRALP